MVLHRPVEPAGLIGNWPEPAQNNAVCVRAPTVPFYSGRFQRCNEQRI